MYRNMRSAFKRVEFDTIQQQKPCKKTLALQQLKQVLFGFEVGPSKDKDTQQLKQIHV